MAVSTADCGVVRRLSENQVTDLGLSTIFKNYSSDFLILQLSMVDIVGFLISLFSIAEERFC